MGKLDIYKIDLKGMTADFLNLDFQIDKGFFETVDAPDVREGNLHCALEVKRVSSGYFLCFHINGIVTVTCDRCLDEMELPVDTTDSLKVKLGPEASDEGDEWVVVAEDEGIIDVAWHIYEFSALSLPMQHMHEEGECNEMMLTELGKHCVDVTEDDETEDEPETDPRWNELKKILDNN